MKYKKQEEEREEIRQTIRDKVRDTCSQHKRVLILLIIAWGILSKNDKISDFAL